jgi:hypothetical protein
MEVFKPEFKDFTFSRVNFLVEMISVQFIDPAMKRTCRDFWLNYEIKVYQLLRLFFSNGLSLEKSSKKYLVDVTC